MQVTRGSSIRTGSTAIVRDGSNPDCLGDVSIRDICMNNESMILQCQTDSSARDVSNLSSGLPSIAKVAPPDDIRPARDRSSHGLEAFAPPHVGGTSSLVYVLIVLVLDASNFGKSLLRLVPVQAIDIKRYGTRARTALPCQYLFTIWNNDCGLDADIAKRGIITVKLGSIKGINNRW